MIKKEFLNLFNAPAFSRTQMAGRNCYGFWYNSGYASINTIAKIVENKGGLMTSNTFFIKLEDGTVRGTVDVKFHTIQIIFKPNMTVD